MSRRLRDEELRAELPVAVRALHVEHLVVMRRLGHVSSVAAGAVRTEP